MLFSFFGASNNFPRLTFAAKLNHTFFKGFIFVEISTPLLIALPLFSNPPVSATKRYSESLLIVHNATEDINLFPSLNSVPTSAAKALGSGCVFLSATAALE